MLPTRPRITWLKNFRVTAAALGLVVALAGPAHAQNSNAVPNSPTPKQESAPANARLIWLRAEIARHDELYFKKNAPEISDAAYDSLKQELRQLEQAPANESSSVSELKSVPSVGDDRSGGFTSTVHRQPMLSLEKAYTEAELRAFIQRVERHTGSSKLNWVIEPKFDGLAISVTYENGRLVRAVTRGDGLQGDDVTENVSTIPGLPPTLPNGYPPVVELRGEVYIDYATFARLNVEREEAGDPPFTQPRNLAAGTLKLHDSREVARRHLSIVFYGLGAWEGSPAKPTTQQALHALVRDWHLPGVDSFKTAHTPEEIWAAVTRLERQRARLGFPTDGVVVKADDCAVQEALGVSAEAPRWAIAYKFPPERVSTRLRAITLQVGRTGIITPVAELDAVVIGGTKIERASLYNADAITRRDLRIGDWVYVEKAGEIIPVVVGPDASMRTSAVTPFEFPLRCPACEGKLVRNEGEATTRCVNRECPGQVKRRIEHYASPEAAGIKGLGPVAIAALVDGRKVKTIADLYRLRSDDLVNIGDVAESVAGQLIEQIEQSKKTRLPRLIYGLSIPGVGRAAAKEWAASFSHLAPWSAANRTALSNPDSLRSTPLEAFFSQQHNFMLIDDLLSLGVSPKTEEALQASGPLSGKTVVITGALPSWTRAEAKQHIEAAGGRVTEAVSRRTHLVVTGEGAGAKLAEARSLGIEILDEAELRKRLTQ
ncbi:MAG: NAD-dependent DNA ligase LigA [Opitutus sp.]|nr:NAD-dependent DNA ligase LigA [Opitutus sp.]MCS6247527.1 NAD-dependent DNA ligase LigA [Opitutus sp.]MCS6274663.1 NAD-dependent DNA ligase LigA [Opitutus sp.]MCS6277341.1 NAD-dependent DNA ligase LigA [Opitutus sp.]MCS6300463.1 NAD-dependent DNA ligase LigA [Opitutus sp.]